MFAGLFDGFDVNGGKPGAAVAGRDGQPCKFYSGVAGMGLGGAGGRETDAFGAVHG